MVSYKVYHDKIILDICSNTAHDIQVSLAISSYWIFRNRHICRVERTKGFKVSTDVRDFGAR
jgi:hypothetical protein